MLENPIFFTASVPDWENFVCFLQFFLWWVCVWNYVHFSFFKNLTMVYFPAMMDVFTNENSVPLPASVSAL